MSLVAPVFWPEPKILHLTQKQFGRSYSSFHNYEFGGRSGAKKQWRRLRAEGCFTRMNVT
jgi:hypothetical protein